jgi:hypothetical protein
MKQTRTKETSTGTPDVGTNPQNWATSILGLARDVGIVVADNMTRQQEAVVQRQPTASPVPWYQQTPILIGGGIAAVVVLMLVMRRK